MSLDEGIYEKELRRGKGMGDRIPRVYKRLEGRSPAIDLLTLKEHRFVWRMCARSKIAELARR